MVRLVAVLAALVGSAAAFAPSRQTIRGATAVGETKSDLEALAKKLNPVLGFYDPLNLAEASFWGTSNEATIGFLRHSEIKHGRIAMFAFVGYIVHANGIKFPWAMQMDGTPFPDADGNPPVLWDSITDDAKWQIFGFIAFLEYWSELSTPNHKVNSRGLNFSSTYYHGIHLITFSSLCKLLYHNCFMSSFSSIIWLEESLVISLISLLDPMASLTLSHSTCMTHLSFPRT
jgi:hypothetical protein